MNSPGRPLTLVGGQVLGSARLGPRPGDERKLLIRGGVVESLDGRRTEGLTFDARGLLIGPGFVDLQCNGGHGIDLTSQPDRLWELAFWLPRYGVTSFLPTLVSARDDEVAAALDALTRRPAAFVGAEPLGWHLEGPVLNPRRRGAHDPSRLQPASPALAARWRRDAGVAMVTLAPELPGALTMIRLLRKQGVVVSAGHTEATAAEMAAAVAEGVTGVTHLFNAMAPFDHRQVGTVGTALTDGRLTVGLIADGVHLDPRAVAIAWRAMGSARTALVTDSVAALGSPATAPSRAGPPISVDGAAVRDAQGTLAGSLLSMDRAVRNLMAFTGCSAEEAVTSASRTPARLLGAGGSGLGPGAGADLVVMTPGAEIVTVVAGGSIVHGADTWGS